MRQIIGLNDIVGMGYGSEEVAGGGALNARDLPKSFVGVPPTTILAGATAEIQVDVQREMRPDRFMIQQPFGRFLVRDIRVGTVSLNASPNPVPDECFGPHAVGVSIRATMTATPSVGIQLVVTNTAAQAEILRGAFFGPSAKPGAGVGGVAGIVGSAESPADAPEMEQHADAKMLPQSFVGIPRTTSPGVGVRVPIQVEIYRDIRPDRLVIPTTTGQNWLVRDIRVGTISLNASIQPVPGECFAPLSFGGRLRATVTATPSVGIQIDVEATDAEAPDFIGAFFGPSRMPTT